MSIVTGKLISVSLTHALIGLLAVEPRTGYELTKFFDETMGRYAWQAGHTSIYPELARLAKRGLVEVAHEGARGSRTYAATEAGRAELRTWLLAPDDGGKVRNEYVLRMFLLSALDPADALTLLRRIAATSAAGAAELREVRAEHGADAIPPGSAGFGQLAAEFGLRQYEATAAWAHWAIEQLESPQRH
jgi:PadR family transcriptional regulator AphA